jgi:hypothetical protein
MLTRLIVTFALLTSVRGQTPTVGRIEGKVSTGGGQAVAAARVQLVSDRDSLPKNGPVVLSTVSSGTGDFTFDEVPLGNYRACVVAAGYLDPCQWATSDLVRLNGPRTTARVVVTEGHLLEVSIADETGLLKSGEKTAEGAFVAVELVDPAGRRRIVPLRDVEQTSRSYAELIPAGVPFRLEVASQKFQIAEISSVPGTRVNGRLELPVMAAARAMQATSRRRTMFDRGLPPPAISVKLKVEARRP